MATVTEEALLGRINRKLAHDGTRIRKTRGARWRGTLGDFYEVDIARNAVLAMKVDIAAWGRDLGVLRDGEVLS